MCELRITDPTGISRLESQILRACSGRVLSRFEPGSVTDLLASLGMDEETGDYRVKASVRLRPKLEMVDVSIQIATT